MYKIKRNELNIVKLEDDIRIKEYAREMLYRQVTIFITDEIGCLIGVITNSSYKRGKGDTKAAINYNFKYVYESDENKIAYMEHTWVKLPNITIPVLDEANRILYAYTQDRIFRLKKVELELEREHLLEKYYQIKQQYKNVKILTDLDLRNCREFADVVNESEIGQGLADFIIIVCYEETWQFNNVIKKLIQYNIKYIAIGNLRTRVRFSREECLVSPVIDYCSLDRYALETLREIGIKKGYYFDSMDMEQICQAISITQGIQGDYLEIGVYRGDSAELACTYMRKRGISRKIFLMDTFEGFSYEEARKSSDMIWKDSHLDTSIDLVKYRLRDFDNICYIKGNIVTDEFSPEIKAIAVCNIDVDLYEAVYAALLKVKDRMVPSGVVICEDFGHMPELSGANYAVKKFLCEYPMDFAPIYLDSGQMFLIKR